MFEEEEELQTEPQVQCDSLGKRGKGVNVLVSLSLNKPVNKWTITHLLVFPLNSTKYHLAH